MRAGGRRHYPQKALGMRELAAGPFLIKFLSANPLLWQENANVRGYFALTLPPRKFMLSQCRAADAACDG